MEVLDLIVKKKEFDLIKGGRVVEKYLEVNDEWIKKLITNYDTCTFSASKAPIYPLFKYKQFDEVRFKYNKNSETIRFKINGINIGQDSPDGGDVFIIEIGQQIADVKPTQLTKTTTKKKK